jgi:hypothetical protein
MGKDLLLTVMLLFCGLGLPWVALQFNHSGSESLSFRIPLFYTLNRVLVCIFILALITTLFKRQYKIASFIFWLLISIQITVSLFQIYLFSV